VGEDRAMRELLKTARVIAPVLTIGAILAPVASADSGQPVVCGNASQRIVAIVAVDTPCSLAKTVALGVGTSTRTPRRSHGYRCSIRRNTAKAHSWVCVKRHTASSNRTIGWTVLTI
jgi:hypothetical protein